MECPHCNQSLAQTDCPTCGGKALTGAKFCHECGHLLPLPGEEPKQLTCSTCHQHLLPGGSFCHHCGESVTTEAEAVEIATGERLACSDGNCIGIIGADGKCSDCGKTYTGPPSED